MKEKMKKQIQKDNYWDIAFRRYLAYKDTELYDELYKLEIFTSLNAYMAETQITSATVVDVAHHIQKSNPSTGSFVHWSNTADLVEFAEAKPEAVAHLWNQLYDDSLPVDERIAQFREEGKAFSSDISLGAPLFGYLLAAYDYKKYLIYKQETYQATKANIQIEHKLG